MIVSSIIYSASYDHNFFKTINFLLFFHILIFISLGNILLKKVIINSNIYWTPKITDFGMARKFRHDQSKTMSASVGTTIYNAPELWTMRHGKASQAYKFEVHFFIFDVRFIV
jgi:serine/threonine protein kinase